MKYIFLFIFLISKNLFALSVELNSAVVDKQKLNFVHIKHETPFPCIAQKDPFNAIVSVECIFDNKPQFNLGKNQTQLLNIEAKIVNDKFKIFIYPTAKLTLEPIDSDLKKYEQISSFKPATCKHWLIIGHEKNLPYINSVEKKNKLSFPVVLKSDTLPYIGPLDIDKNPIFFDDNKDFSAYLGIKKLFENEEYERLIEESDKILASNPDIIFLNEILLFKIKALDKLNQESKYDELIEIGKKWLKIYPADEFVPDVLLIIAQTYTKEGLNLEAKYFFDRILTEHSDSEVSNMAKIFIADEAYKKGDTKNAFTNYTKAMLETKDLQIASIAAVRMGEKYLEQKEFNKSIPYYDKVFSANKEFLFTNLEQSYDLSVALAESTHYEMPIKIALELLEKFQKSDDLYEKNLKNIGDWYALSGELKKALEYYRRYESEFPYGENIDNVKVAIDKLLFELPDDNRTKLHERYDYLIKEYSDDEISKKAFYKKIKLFMDDRNFSAVLAFKRDIANLPETIAPDKFEIVYDAAKNLATNYLKNGECQKSIVLIQDYNVTVDKELNSELYNCSMKSGVYSSAEQIALSMIESHDFDLKLKWLYNLEKAIVKLEKNVDVINVCEDIISLTDNFKKHKEYNDILYDLFDMYIKTKMYDKAILLVKDIETNFSNNYKNIAVYKELVKIFQNRLDYLMVSNYANKIIELQKRYNSYLETPWIEFSLIEALKRLNKENESLKILEELNSKKLEPKDKVRVLYLLGTIYQKNSDVRYKDIYQECVDINVTSAWKNLCGDALKLFK
ncbi:MAG: tetratricopeptide repeat protein [Campylobacterales bacterium]|nr:tetratricopeptide repeat protein [Campylobacterales bacterium]